MSFYRKIYILTDEMCRILTKFLLKKIFLVHLLRIEIGTDYKL